MTDTTETMKQRLLRESEAMVLYVSGRGLQKDLPKDGSLDVLDSDPSKRESTPLRQLLGLHQTLSRLVAPALPETLALLQFHQEMSGKKGEGWRRIAPLSSIIFLIIFTVAIALLLGIFVVTKDSSFLQPLQMDNALNFLQGKCRSPVLFQKEINDILAAKNAAASALSPENAATFYQTTINAAEIDIRADCQQQRTNATFGLYLFFGMIGALGAAYSSIYDSFAFIREGIYDIRLASTYYIRIFLGAFSGILLAEPLSEYLDTSTFSSTLLAFTGGFAAQLVYDILTKIVDSVANMFRPERRKERIAIHEQAVLSAREAILEDDAARRAELAEVVETTQSIKDPQKRADALQTAVIGMMSQKSDALDDLKDRLAAHPSNQPRLSRLISMLQLGDKVLPLLPGDPDPKTELDLKHTLSTLQTAHVGGGVAGPALSQAEHHDPTTPRIRDALTGLATVFDPAHTTAIAKTAVIVPHMFTDTQLLRWRSAAYGATPDSQLMLLADADDATLTDIQGDPIADAIRQFLNQQTSTRPLRALFSAADPVRLSDTLKPSGMDDAGFDLALTHWVTAVATKLLGDDLQTTVVPMLDQSISGADLVQAALQVPGHDAATAGLQHLELFGGSIADCDAPATVLADLLATIDQEIRKGES